MKKSTILLTIFLLCFTAPQLKAQLIIQPSIGSKTHPSMSIDSIMIGEKSTLCYLKLENQNTEGNAWFCADKDIHLIELSSGKKHLLTKAIDIPVCPELHRFKNTGEKLRFMLKFPPLNDKTGEIDIVENCADNCFSLKGIILDSRLNEEIRLFENGVSLYNQELFDQALKVFEFLKGSSFKDENHYGYSLYILPVLHYKMNDLTSAKYAYEELKSSDILEREYFLKKLHEIEFFQELK